MAGRGDGSRWDKVPLSFWPHQGQSVQHRLCSGVPGVFQLLNETTPRFVLERQGEGGVPLRPPFSPRPPPGHPPRKPGHKQPRLAKPGKPSRTTGPGQRAVQPPLAHLNPPGPAPFTLAPIWLPHWPAWMCTISLMLHRRRGCCDGGGGGLEGGGQRQERRARSDWRRRPGSAGGFYRGRLLLHPGWALTSPPRPRPIRRRRCKIPHRLQHQDQARWQEAERRRWAWPRGIGRFASSARYAARLAPGSAGEERL